MNGKSFLITGGASGLGAATAKAVLQHGAKHVIIFDIQEIKELKNEIQQKFGDDKYYYYNCDVTSEEEADRALRTAVEDHGPIDCVVNNAGITNDGNYKQEIDINFTGLVRTTLKALEHMRIDKGGRGGTVVNISSTTALEADPQFLILPIYSATKGAILHFTNCLASNATWEQTGVRLMTICYGLFQSNATWEQTGVRLMTICYGATDTPMAYKPIYCAIDYLEEVFTKFRHKYKLQSAEVAVQALIQAYKTGAPGSTWLATDNKPPIDLTEKINEAHAIMAACT